MAFDNKIAVANNFTSYKNSVSSRRGVVTSEIAIMDGTATHEECEVANARQADLEAEEVERKMPDDSIAPSLSSAASYADAVVDASGVATAAHINVLDTLPMPTDPCNDVFNTPELLEAIVSLLPMRDILSNAQRVSRSWKNAVAQSPSFQRRLWLRSSTEEVASPVEYLATHDSEWPPSLHLPSYMPTYADNVVNNPTFISDTSGYRSSTMVKIDAGAMYHRASFAIPRTSSDTMRPTWLNMHVTEPSIKVAQLHIQQPKWGGMQRRHNGIWVSVQDANGLTFVTILETAQKVCDGFPVDLPGRDQACVVIWFLTKDTEE